MPRNVFNEVFVTVSVEKFFQASQDAAGKSGASPIQKVVSALRKFCYGLSADRVEEYSGLSESISRKSLKIFCQAVVKHLGRKYLRT